LYLSILLMIFFLIVKCSQINLIQFFFLLNENSAEYVSFFFVH